jgi:gliding motility-associated-like protein
VKINKTILFTFILCGLLFCLKGQTVLPYTQDNICLDQLINVNLSSLANVKNLVVKDLNNDGNKEVIVADATASIIKIYSFLPAQGTFTIQSFINVPGTFGTGKNRAIDAGFFDAGSFMDLVFTTDSFIYVYKNNTNFNFTQQYKIPIPMNFIAQEHYLKTDNINNNGFDDFYLISSSTSAGPGIRVMPYLSTLTNIVPQPAQTICKSAGNLFTPSIDISIGNVKNDMDGLKDVMITNSNIADSVFFLENTSTSSAISLNNIPLFLPPTFPFSTPDFLISNSELADINSDNKLDFIFYGSSATGDKIAVYAGNNNFNLNIHVNIPTSGIKIHDFKIADINDDVIPDFIAIGNYSLTSVSGILFSKGNNNTSSYFDPAITITFTNTSLKLDELQITDVDNNGINDIVIKPWKLSIDRTYMIPNFSFTISAGATPSINCNANASTLTAINTSTSSNYNWLFVPTGSVVSTSSTFTTITNGEYVASLDIDMYSNYTCTQKSDTVKVISNTPIINITTPQNITICQNTTITTTASGAISYTWTSSQTGFISNNPTILIPGISANTFTIVGLLANGCKGTNTLSVNLFSQNTDNIIASKNPACVGELITLGFPAATSYTWINNTTSPTVIVSPSITTVYPLTIKDLNGCISSKSIKLDIDPDCLPKIYHGISLNGDGTNDVFTIDNIEDFKNNHVSIFNRWGREIFSTSNYNNTTNYWPKKEDLNNLMPSTYFYVVNFGDGSEIQKGWIELIKN